MPESDALGDLWDSLKGLGSAAEGGLESLWNHIKSGHQKAEADLPKPMQKIEEGAGALAQDVGAIGKGMVETAKIPGEVYQSGEVGSPEMEQQAREFAGTFGAAGSVVPRPRGSIGMAGREVVPRPEGGGGVPPPERPIGPPPEQAALPPPPEQRALPPPPEQAAPPPPERPPTEPEGGMPTSWTAEPTETPRPSTLTESPATIADRLGAMHWTEGILNKLHTNASADQFEFIQKYKDEVAGQITPEEKIQLEANLEWHPGLPQAPVLQPHVQRIMDEVVRPSQARALADWKYLKENTDLDPDLVQRMEGENEGYLHRIRVSPRAPMGNQPFAPFAGVRSLSQTTSSMQKRAFWVAQRGDERLFMKGERPADYGAKTRDDQGRQWTIQRATIPEVEANTDNRFLRDPVLATLQNEQQLKIARRNVEALQGEILPEMVRRGLGSADRGSVKANGFRETDIPALRGHYFEPRVANQLNDFYRTPSLLNLDDPGTSKGLTWFGNLNRFAINAMFLNPLGHMRNVLSDYMLARSGIWGAGDGTFAPHMRAAFSDIYNKSPLYMQTLRNGGNLLGMDASNRVAWTSLMKRVTEEMARDPNIDRIFRDTPWNGSKGFAQDIWNQSQRQMWAFHDLMMMAQLRASMAKGLPLAEAIPQAEKYIANYRVPASIGEGGKLKLSPVTARRLSRLMQDRSITVFGRYHYNKLAALKNVMKEGWQALQGDAGLSPAQRKEALARAGYLVAISSLIPAGVNFALEESTGNPEARLHIPGAAGLTANAARAASQLFRGQIGEAGFDFWSSLSGILTPAPALSESLGLLTNTDLFSGQPIRSRHLSAGEQATQVGGHIAGQMLAPAREALDIVRGKGVPSLGISTPDPGAVARARRGPPPHIVRSERRRFERQYPWYPE